MSDVDSFIEEVTEEVRRDRLFALMRKYGWIVILAIVLLVGGAAWNEWRKAEAEKRARALGDSLVAATEIEDPAGRLEAIRAIRAEGPAAALVAMLEGNALVALGRTDEAQAAFAKAAAVSEAGPHWQDLARLKAAMLEKTPEARIAAFTPLAAPGAPYRPLALEQIAWAKLDAGDRAGAVAQLRELLVAPESPPGTRQRASQLLTALGAEPGAPADVPSPAGSKSQGG